MQLMKIKVYKAMSDSLEYCKIMNCIILSMLSILLNYFVGIGKPWMGSVSIKTYENKNVKNYFTLKV